MDAIALDPREEEARTRLQRAVGAEYEVVRLVGRGGFADVFEAREPRLERSVAIKVVWRDVGSTPELLHRFQREARAMAGLRHPNVMEIYTVGASDDVAYFVMPLVDGESLRNKIDREGALAIDDGVRILAEAAGALDEAHRAGTVHRDVKPDNIMLDGERSRVLITDFGIAKALGGDTSSLTRSSFVGTPRYVSPEQATGEEADHRSDVYSLGVVAFEMVAGRPPFEAKTMQAIIAKHLTEEAPPLRLLRPECPERLARVVARCLAKDPGARWASLAEVVEALEGEDDLTLETAAPQPPMKALIAPVRALRRATGMTLGSLFVLVMLDMSIGLAGVSMWVAAGALAYLAGRAGRLWREGYEWRDLLLASSDRLAVVGGAIAQPGSGIDGGDFGRFSSLVRTTASDRAGIMKAYAALPHIEQGRLRGLAPAVDGLVTRAKHLAHRVVGLEARLAEAASKLELAGGVDGPAELRPVTQTHHAARLHELDSAREDAARELRACIARLDQLRETLCDGVLEEAPGAMEVMSRTLAETEAYLSRRAV